MQRVSMTRIDPSCVGESKCKMRPRAGQRNEHHCGFSGEGGIAEQVCANLLLNSAEPDPLISLAR